MYNPTVQTVGFDVCCWGTTGTFLVPEGVVWGRMTGENLSGSHAVVSPGETEVLVEREGEEQVLADMVLVDEPALGDGHVVGGVDEIDVDAVSKWRLECMFFSNDLCNLIWEDDSWVVSDVVRMDEHDYSEGETVYDVDLVYGAVTEEGVGVMLPSGQ